MCMYIYIYIRVCSLLRLQTSAYSNMIQDFLSLLFWSNYLMYGFILIIMSSVQYHMYKKTSNKKEEIWPFEHASKRLSHMKTIKQKKGEKLLAVFIKSITTHTNKSLFFVLVQNHSLLVALKKTFFV